MNQMKRLPFLRGLFIIGFLIGGAGEIYGVPTQNPNQMEIVKEGQGFGPEEIARVLENHFEKVVDYRNKRIEVKEVRYYDKVVLPPGNVSCEVILPEQAHRGGNISGTLLFLVNGREVKKARVSARVDIWADVIASRHYLSRYHEIQERDIQWINRNISFIPPDFLTEMKEVLGRRTTISINHNETIRAGMVEIPPLVKKGDRVILLVENHRFRITTPGEAKEDGRKGERIRLVNLSSRKEVSGKVLDLNTVQIDF
jgi:flagella basal body P-ring formation protein FlgA